MVVSVGSYFRGKIEIWWVSGWGNERKRRMDAFFGFFILGAGRDSVIFVRDKDGRVVFIRRFREV